MRYSALFILILACLQTAASQDAPAAPSPGAVSTLKVDVKLVPVRVVVRDSQGRAVGNLAKDDFQLFDQGKLQVITQFSIEQSGAQRATEPTQLGDKNTPRAASGRYLLYLFDDLHLERTDLVQAREAVDRQLASLSSARERAAIFTTSGQKGLDFTSDRRKLHEALSHLEPRGRQRASDCPKMSYYMADLIVNRGDEDVLQVATQDALKCGFDGNRKFTKSARAMARGVAAEEAGIGRVETQASLHILKDLVQGMSKAPGERTIVIVSPGLFVAEEQAQGEITDLAVRADVTVSALDPRGLIAPNDVTQTGAFDPNKLAYGSLSDSQEWALLEELADGTGGVFFHSNNDVEEGFRRVTAAPEYSYVLAFSPQEVKLDGRFHKVKVTLKNTGRLTVQARKGYYAPKRKP